jgi:hypothetical protein
MAWTAKTSLEGLLGIRERVLCPELEFCLQIISEDVKVEPPSPEISESLEAAWQVFMIYRTWREFNFENIAELSRWHELAASGRRQCKPCRSARATCSASSVAKRRARRSEP